MVGFKDKSHLQEIQLGLFKNKEQDNNQLNKRKKKYKLA